MVKHQMEGCIHAVLALGGVHAWDELDLPWKFDHVAIKQAKLLRPTHIPPPLGRSDMHVYLCNDNSNCNCAFLISL